jgi:hypothetical protein
VNLSLASMNLSDTTSQSSCRSRNPFSSAWIAVVLSEAVVSYTGLSVRRSAVLTHQMSGF